MDSVVYYPPWRKTKRKITMTRNEVRVIFKRMGYDVSLLKHALIHNGLRLTVMKNGCVIAGSGIICDDAHRAEHSEAIQASMALDRTLLETGEKIICR